MTSADSPPHPDAPVDAGSVEASPPPPRPKRGHGGLIALAVMIPLVAAGVLILPDLMERAVAPVSPEVAAPEAPDAPPAPVASAPPAQNDAAREIEALRAEMAQMRAELDAAPAPAPQPEPEPEPVPSMDADSAPGAGMDMDPMPAPVLVSPPPPGLAVRLAALEAAAPGVARNENRLDQIENRLAELADMIDQTPARRDFAALEMRLAALERQTARSPAESAWRFAALREAAGGGAPFADAHAALARLRPDDAALAAIRDAAVTGVPTMEELRRTFPATEIRAALADAPAAADTGRFAGLRGMLGGLVSVRRADTDASGGAAGSAVAAAEAALDAGDLPGAVAAAQALTGGAAQTAAYWLGRAQARLRLNDRIDAVGQSLTQEAAR